MRILVVDDDANMRGLLSNILRKWDHDVRLATNGQEALDLIKQDDINFVITDWLMPVMDGPTLCKQIRLSDSSGYVYIVLLTSLNEKSAVIEGMRAGADDFVSKCFNQEELHQRIRAGQRILKLQQELEERNRKLERANDTIENDLKVASAFQRRLLPGQSSAILGVTFESVFLPSSHVGGDTFNFFQLDEHNVGFYLLDVSGHGVASALYSASLSGVISPCPLGESPLRSPVPESPHYRIVEPAEVLADLNRTYQSDCEIDQYFTMVYGIVDLRDDSIRFCQAAHPSPILLTPGKHAQLLGDGGFPVGLIPEAEYTQVEASFHIGDRLIVHSDGVTECLNSRDEQFTEKRLVGLIEKNRDKSSLELLSVVWTGMESWTGRVDFDDDISMIAIERTD